MSRSDWFGTAVALLLAGGLYFLVGPLYAISAIILGFVILIVVHLQGSEDKPEPMIGDTLRIAARAVTKFAYPWVSANTSINGEGKPVKAIRLSYYVRDWPTTNKDLLKGRLSVDSLFHLKIDVHKIDVIVGNGQRMTRFAPLLDVSEWNRADATSKPTPWIPLEHDTTVLIYRAEARKACWDGYLILNKTGNHLNREEAISGTVTLDDGKPKQMAITVSTRWVDQRQITDIHYEYHDLTAIRLKELGIPEIVLGT